MRWIPLALGVALALAGAAFASPAAPPEARRLMTLLAGMRDEYREAFDASGRLVRAIEVEEAKLLLAEARDLASKQPGWAPPNLGAELNALGEGFTRLVPSAEIVDRLEALRTALATSAGVSDESVMAAPPSTARGATVYADNCAGCHGATGTGDGADAMAQGLHPANFAALDFVRGETPQDFFNVVTLGRRRSGMPAWGDALGAQARWDVVAYVWSLHRTPAEVAEGQGLYLTQCAGCHGAAGAGDGLYARSIGQLPDLTQWSDAAQFSDAALFALIAEGRAGTAMPAFARALDEASRWKLVAYLRTLSLERTGAVAPIAEPATVDSQTAPDLVAAFAEVHRLVDEAVAAHAHGQPDALSIGTDGYMRFEPFEKRLGAIDLDKVRAVEEGFLAFRAGLRDPASAEPARLAPQLHERLRAAEAALQPAVGPVAPFLQSAGIILREGFEIVLIVGALFTYVRRSGQDRLLTALRSGMLAGIVASVATAVVLRTVFGLVPGAGDALEGAAMLVAAGVLFWVSYWIISKAEADRWQRYIQGKVAGALASGSASALAGAAFLAVYREGFETVLFYQALLGGAPTGPVLAGFATGLALLSVVWVAFNRLGKRLPIQQFFLITGGFLYLMSFVFAGRGIRELQEAQFVSVTPLPWMPTIELLGIYPSVETLAAQSVLVACLAYAVVVTLRARRAATAPAGAPPAVIAPAPKRSVG